MNNFSLLTFLTSNVQIEEDEILKIIENCSIKSFRKDDFLVQSNETCRHTFFVEKGILRQYSIDKKGKEHILQFATENWFISERESVFFNQPTRYFIQAIEDSQVVLIDEIFIKLLSERIPSFVDFNNRLLHHHILNLQNRINLLLSADAQERYLAFIKMYPDVLLRVPQIMVASYLGIAPESLSRVRKKLAEKNRKR